VDPLTSLFNKEARTGAGRPRRSVLITIGVLVGLAVAVLIVLKLLSMYGDWLWFGELKLRVVFWQTLLSQLVTGVVFALLFFVIVWGNAELARRLVPRLRPVGEDTVEYAHEALYRLIGRVTLAALAVIAIIVGYSVSGSWMTFQRALHASSFGTRDPVFHHDLGFYIFSVPAWHYLQTFIFA
jgi:uncharacterized membrane protein (UPF0182 family)